ncbi:MAG: hypothetical protein HYT27_00665 [Parcubacteria group bacterium]|nr:hypothetical protein [Parcubacteria group bacterium]
MTPEGFSPQITEVERGDIVIFENVGTKDHWPASNIHPTHTLYPGSDIRKCDSDEAQKIFDACKPVSPGESYVFTFDSAGTWRFHDHLNSQLGGEIITKEEFFKKGSVKRMSFLGEFIYFKIGQLASMAFSGSLEKKFNNLDIQETLRNGPAPFWLGSVGLEALMHKLENDSRTQNFNCHTAGHLLGRSAYRVFQFSSPFSNLDARCQFGYFHGTIESFIGSVGDQNTVSSMFNSCQTLNNLVKRIMCYHGVGHGIMVYENYDLLAAVSGCKKALDNFATARCYTGVFMENIFTKTGFSVDPVHTSHWLKETDLQYPCNVIEDTDIRVQAQCYTILPHLLFLHYNLSADSVVGECLKVSAQHVPDCVQGIGFFVSANASPKTIAQPQLFAVLCNKILNQKQAEECASGVILGYILLWGNSYLDKAREFCDLIRTGSSFCFSMIDYLTETGEVDLSNRI